VRSGLPALRSIVRSPRVLSRLRTTGTFLRALWHHCHEDHVSTRAAAIAYHALLSFFPFLLLCAAAATLLVGDDPQEVHAFLDSVRDYVPALRQDFWEDVTTQVAQRRSVLSGASLLLLLLVASRVGDAVQAALHVILRVRSPRHPRFVAGLLLRVRALALTIVVLAAMAGIFVAKNVAVYVTLAHFPGAGTLAPVVTQPFVLRLLLPGLVVGWLVYVVLRRVSRDQVERRHAALGAVVFAVGHDLALLAASRLTLDIARQDLLFGSFVGVTWLMVWAYWVSFLLLVTAEVVAMVGGARDLADGGGHGPPRSSLP
jgi:YihY family inner membrane protein